MTPHPEDIALEEELCHIYQKSQALARIVAYTAPLRELAEIGRLAVELARVGQELDFNGCMSKGEELGKASAAYLAKQKETTP